MKRTFGNVSLTHVVVFIAVVGGAFLGRDLLGVPMYIASPVSGLLVATLWLLFQKPRPNLWQYYREILILCAIVSLLLWVFGPQHPFRK
jgi:hypothetical protein